MIRIWTERWPDGCRSCRTKTRPHHGQGYCTRCYRRKEAKGQLTRRNKLARRRGSGSKAEFFCYVCSAWKPASQFTQGNKRQTCCHDCHLELRRTRYAERREELNAQRRQRYQETMKEIRKADRKRAKIGDPWGAGRVVVPREAVQRWLDIALLMHDGNISETARTLGYHEKNIRRMRDAPRGITVDAAENLAFVAGTTEELRELLQPGIENWSKAGHRFCQRCGRYDVPHYARGHCRRCYCIVWWHETRGQEPTLPKEERWSMRHTSCVLCGRSKFRHQGHGVCSSCYQTWRRKRCR